MRFYSAPGPDPEEELPTGLTPGDMLYVNAAGVLTRLPRGPNGHFLKMDANYPGWVAPPEALDPNINSYTRSEVNALLNNRSIRYLGRTREGTAIQSLSGTSGYLSTTLVRMSANSPTGYAVISGANNTSTTGITIQAIGSWLLTYTVSGYCGGSASGQLLCSLASSLSSYAQDPGSMTRYYNNGQPADNFSLSGQRIITLLEEQTFRVRLDYATGVSPQITHALFYATWLGPHIDQT